MSWDEIYKEFEVSKHTDFKLWLIETFQPPKVRVKKRIYFKVKIIGGERFCRIDGCNNKAQNNTTLCSKHKHQRRKELMFKKLLNK